MREGWRIASPRKGAKVEESRQMGGDKRVSVEGARVLAALDNIVQRET